jgi:tetratricopeptide (TPR) repeat protein
MSPTFPRISKIVFFATIVMLIQFFPSRSIAQGTVLRGVVQDESKKPLPKVKIVLLDLERGTRFETRSNKKGEFMQVGIPPSAYRATFELEGYIPHETMISLKPGLEDRAVIVLKKVPLKIDDDKDFAEGISRFQEGRYQDAVDFFLKVREKFPNHVETFYNLGVAYLRLGRTESAIEALEKAVQLKADAVEPYLALGECHVLLGQSDKAMEAFSRAVALDPDNPGPYVNLGLVYYRSDKSDDALRSFEKAIQLDPKLSVAHYQAGLASIKKGDFKRAIKYFEAFLELEPDCPEAKQVRAMIDELKKIQNKRRKPRPFDWGA